MRILIVNYEYPPLGGGGGVATRDWAIALAKNHTVHVVTTLPGTALRQKIGPLATYELQHGVHIHRVQVVQRTNLATATLLSMITFMPMALWRCWQLTAQQTFDVINAQFVLPSGLPAALAARWRHIPFVISFIGGDIYDPSKGVSPHRFNFLRFLIRFIARQAVAGTAISSDTKQRTQMLHGVTLPITVTPLGIKSTPIIPLSRAQLQLPLGVPVVISVGRLITRKNYAQLVRLWPQIPSAHLIILGDGPLRGALQQQCQKLGLTKRIHLIGYVSESRKMSLLAAADVYVSASTHEGFGIVFLEAMHAGLQIVATNNGGQTDFLRDGHNALLVPPEDDVALQRGVTKLLADQTLRERLAVNNREEVTQYYIEETYQKFESVLQAAAQRQAL